MGSFEDGVNAVSFNEIMVYHASTEVVEIPQWDYKKNGLEKTLKDFGQGFYTSDDTEYPVTLYCEEDTVILNSYKLDLSGLEIIKLQDNLQWVMIVAAHRRDFSDYTEWHYIRDDLRRYIASFDLIIGTISDDRLFSTFEGFLDNDIPDDIVLKTLNSIKYPKQYVFKSDKACSQLRYTGHKIIATSELLAAREKKKRERDSMISTVRRIKAEYHNNREANNGKLFSQMVEELNNSGKI